MSMKKLFSALVMCGLLAGFGGGWFANSAQAAAESGLAPQPSYQNVRIESVTINYAQEGTAEPVETASEAAAMTEVNPNEGTAAPVDSQATAEEVVAAKFEPIPGAPPARIVINTASRGLYFYNHGVKTRLFPIAIGAPSSPTPVGYYKIIEMEVNPSWIDPKTGKVVPSGPACPLGYRWIRFHGNYGIHGTNNEASIGTYVSNGCIRMFEKDVEELYDLVDYGTPVEITYNRVVVEKAYDDTVVYYIYPDGYHMQPLTKEDVEVWLKGFGVNSFVSDEDIEKKIKESDGNPTYIAKAYEMHIDGQKVENAKAVIKDGITYLPAISVAMAVGTSVKEDAESGIIVTGYGRAPAYIFKDMMYANADDSQSLFRLQGELNKGVYHMYTVKAPAIAEANTERHPWADQTGSTTVIVDKAIDTTNDKVSDQTTNSTVIVKVTAN